MKYESPKPVHKMSVSVQQILADAKKLAVRLKDHDSSADMLLSQAQAMYRQVDAMKEYQEELVELNTAAHQRPHLDLIANIQQENRQLRALESENKELKSALEEHQNTLELIMSKYRQQISRLLEANHAEKSLSKLLPDTRKTEEQAEKINDMISVMESSIKLDDKYVQKEIELFSKLSTENKGLKELLDIASHNGSLMRNSLLCISNEDKEVQADVSASSESSNPVE